MKDIISYLYQWLSNILKENYLYICLNLNLQNFTKKIAYFLSCESTVSHNFMPIAHWGPINQFYIRYYIWGSFLGVGRQFKPFQMTRVTSRKLMIAKKPMLYERVHYLTALTYHHFYFLTNHQVFELVMIIKF